MKKLLTFLIAFITSIGLMNAETGTFGAANKANNVDAECPGFIIPGAYNANGTSKVSVYGTDKGTKVRTNKMSIDQTVDKTLEFTVNEYTTITALEMGIVTNDASNSLTLKTVYVDGNPIEDIGTPILLPNTGNATGATIINLTGIAAKKHIWFEFDTSGYNGSNEQVFVAGKVTYDVLKLEQLMAPQITFDDNTGVVTITPVANATKIVYTTDGTKPTSESTEYIGPFSVLDGTVVNAMAVGDGDMYSNSSVTEVQVILVGLTAEVPTISQFNGTFAISSATELASYEYSLDGGNTWTEYTIPVTLFENKTVMARASREGWTTSDVAEAEITALPGLDGKKTVYLGADAFDIVAATSSKGGVLTGKAGSDADGYSIEIMTANKGWAKDSKKITIAEGVERTAFYGSNGAQNTVYLPEGVTVYRATFYSYMPSLGRTSGWNEVNGEKFDYYNDIPLLSKDPANPDIRVFDFGEEGVTDCFTFSQTGERPNFVLVLDYTVESEDPWEASYPHTWNFQHWSGATVANIKADSNWSDIEYASALEPTEASKDNCFWQVSASKGLSPNKYVKANRTTIEELAGLKYLNTNNRSLAIAVNYPGPDTDGGFGPYHGESYLWLGGNTEVDYFSIPGVPAGATIKMGVESHRLSAERGVKLTVNGDELKAPNGDSVAQPKEYTEQTWVVPTSAEESNEVKVSITSGCHIYFITVTPAERQIQEYTIQYKANGEVINGTEKTKTGFVGDPVEVTEEDKAEFSITDGDVTTTYTYSEDDSEGMTIAADGTTVVTIKMTATQKRVNTLYSWDFTNWTEETVNNLKAGDNWSDIEKADGTNPTDGNCFWLVSTELDGNNFLKANNTVIEDLKGLAYTYEQDTRNLAIAVNYPETSLGVYSGPSYLWLGGAKINYFKILSVPAGATIKMGVESHKNGDPRGVQLSVNKTTLTAPDGSTVSVPTTYTEQEWLVPADAAETNDVQIYNTNGCHIYYIKVTHPELQKYTLRYVAGEKTLKEVTKFGIADSQISLTDEDKASFSSEDNTLKYIFDHVENENMTVDADGKTIVTIYMTPLEYATISWSAESTSLKIRDEFIAPTLNNPKNLPVKFESDNTEVATVDEDGTISLVEGGIGTAVISATYDGESEDSKYLTTTVTTTIEVTTNVTDAYAWEEYEKIESIKLNKLYTADEKDSKKSLAAGTLIDDDIINIKTVYSAKYSNYGKEYLGNKFIGAVQLGRVDAAPTEENKNGTEKADNSPIIITPNVDCKVVMFLRRQALEQRTSDKDDEVNNVITRTHHIGMSPNDGKSIYAVAHSDINTKLDQNLVFGAYGENNAKGENDYIFCAVEWNMKAGETYTVYTRGTTIAMNGIGYYVDVTGITFDNEEETLTLNEEKALPATILSQTSVIVPISWKSDNEDIATVDSEGNVTGVKVGTTKITAECLGFTAECTVKVYPTEGDADYSGAVDINDAIDIANFVVGKKTVADEDLEFYRKAANANGDEDGMITFADASATVKIALDASTSASTQSRIRAAYDESADALVIGRASTSSRGTVIPVSLENAGAYVAFQADIILPDGMDVEVKAADAVAATHTLKTKKHADNHIRVALFNFGGNAFAAGEAPVIEIVTDSFVSASDIVITDIIASDADANASLLASKTAATNGVAAIGLDEDAPVKVYDINGIYVSDTMEGLQQGTYIVRQGENAKTVRIRN